MVKLKATKPFKYSTRRLLPGDEFEATQRDARLLIAIRKAQAIRAEAEVPAPPASVAAKIAEALGPADDYTALRADYERAVGKRPYMGWDAATLREKIAAAKAGQ